MKRAVEPRGHGVEHLGQPVQFIAVAGARNFFTEIILVDFFHRARQRGDGRERAAGKPPAAQ